MFTILDYLEKLKGAKEIGLFVADQDPLNQNEDAIASDGFAVSELPNFEGEGDYLFIIDSENAKALYDFASEYPSGQVSFMDRMGNRIWKTPQYEKCRVVFLGERNILVELQNQGLDFTGVCGMAYQA